MNTNVKNKPVPSNNQFCEACELEALVKQVKAKGDFLEKVFGALLAAKHEHISITDPLMVALQNPEIYCALNFLFKNPLLYSQCFNKAFHHLQFGEMVKDVETPWAEVVRAFAEIKDSLLIAHLNTVNSIS